MTGGPSAPTCTFERLHDATPTLDGPRRLRFFEHLPPHMQGDCWTKQRERLEGERVLNGELSLRGRRRGLRLVKSPNPQRSADLKSSCRQDDVLDTIPPAEYVEALTGEAVPAHGSICCPLPGHDDRSPSFKVYSEPGRGWYCYGCHRGGGAIDLAAELFGVEPRGEGFHELRRRIAERLLHSPVAA